MEVRTTDLTLFGDDFMVVRCVENCNELQRTIVTLLLVYNVIMNALDCLQHYIGSSVPAL